MKQYKPGQFVSIGGNLAKVNTITESTMNVCGTCKRENGNNIPLYKQYCIHVSECSKKLNEDLYPKFIKQCKKQEKQ